MTSDVEMRIIASCLNVLPRIPLLIKETSKTKNRHHIDINHSYKSALGHFLEGDGLIQPTTEQ